MSVGRCSGLAVVRTCTLEGVGVCIFLTLFFGDFTLDVTSEQIDYFPHPHVHSCRAL